jgi:hypothetical protein
MRFGMHALKAAALRERQACEYRHCFIWFALSGARKAAALRRWGAEKLRQSFPLLKLQALFRLRGKKSYSCSFHAAPPAYAMGFFDRRAAPHA